jgi:hypothetical protein
MLRTTCIYCVVDKSAVACYRSLVGAALVVGAGAYHGGWNYICAMHCII